MIVKAKMPFAFKQLLERIACEKAPGPSATFSIFHIVKAIEVIAEKPVGRGKLAENLDVGEGVVRTMLERLRDAGLVTTSKAGCALTKRGLRLWRDYESVFERKAEIEKNELTIADYSFSVLIKDRGHKVKSGVEQRDAAVMAGARGATTMMFKRGRLVIPSVSNDVTKDFPRAAKQITTVLHPEENDVVVISSADNLQKAEYSVLAAAWTLLDNRQKAEA